MKKTIIISLVIIFIVIIGVGVWYVVFNKPTEDQFKDWKTYRNEEYGFEIKYPGTFFVKEEKNRQIGFYYRPFKGTEEYNLLLEHEIFDDLAIFETVIERGITSEYSLIWEEKEDNLSIPDYLKKIIDFPDLKVIQVGATLDNVPVFDISMEQPDSYWQKFEPAGSGLEPRLGTFEYNNWRFYLTAWRDALMWFNLGLEKDLSLEGKKYSDKYKNLHLKILSTFKFIK